MNQAKREMVEQHLAQADRHVSNGERLLRHQRMTIEERRRDGHDVELATDLLAQMEESQRLHVARRARLRQNCTTPTAEARTPPEYARGSAPKHQARVLRLQA